MLHANKKVLDEKKTKVAAVAKQLKSACTGIFVDYKGITVEEDTALRKELREAGVKYSVVKNSILSFAIKEAGYDSLKEVLTGTTAMATCENDLVAPAKILRKFAKKHDKFKIKGGFVEGGVIDAAGVVSLADLPSKEVLIAKMLGSFNAPISGLVNVLNGNIRGLVVALNAIAEKKSA